MHKRVTELDRVADIASSPMVAGRMICAVSFQGRVPCFDLGNRNLVCAHDISNSAGLAIDKRYLYVSDEKDLIHALDIINGASIWKQDKLSLRCLTTQLTYHEMIVVADIQGVVHFMNRDNNSLVACQPTDGSEVVTPLQALGSRLLAQTSKGGIFAIEAK